MPRLQFQRRPIDIVAIGIISVGAAVMAFTISAILFESYTGYPLLMSESIKQWEVRCRTNGGTILPTERRHAPRAGIFYNGWICAKIEIIDP